LEIAKKIYLDKELAYLYVKLFYPDKSLLIKARNMKYPAIDYTDSDLVLFLPMGNSIAFFIQALLSHALNLRGARSKFILCDRKLPICVAKTIDNINTESCHYCYYTRKKLASNMNLSVKWIGEFIKDKDIINANKFVSSLDLDEYYGLKYKGVNIGKYAEAATKRFLQTGVIENKEFNKNIFSQYLVSAVLLVELSERILERTKPTHLIINDVAYLNGVFMDYFTKNKIKCIVHGIGILKNHLNLNHLDQERKDILVISSKVWKKYTAQTLSGTQKKELEELLSSRVRGTGMFVDHGKFAQIKTKKKIVESLNIDINKNIGVLFTNLLWDASLAGVDVVFKNPFEWIYETINWFTHRNEKLLIVKVHPAEEIVGTRLSFTSYINSKFPELPENIIVLPPKTEISTYGLFDIADYAIVYTSTAGLEMAIGCFPVITTAQTHYRERGFTFDATDKEEYFDFLENVKKLEMTPKMRDLANKYGYLHFCDREIPFKFIKFGGENFSSPELRLKDWHELLPGSDENLDKICDGIIYGKEFLRSYHE
jgi:hypothetical protein